MEIDPPELPQAPDAPQASAAPVHNELTQLKKPTFPETAKLLSEPSEASSWIDTSAKRVSPNSDVAFFIDAAKFYADLATTLVAKATSDSIIFLAGWACISDFALGGKPGGTLAQVFAACSAKGARIYALIWDNFFFAAACTKTVNMINSLKTGAAILDNRTAIVGSHHQKIIGIINSETAAAYCGGMDINTDRVQQTIPSGPLHDTHLRVEGGAGVDLASIFFDRWNDHPLNNGKITLPIMKSTFAFPFTTRVGVTYPRIDGRTNIAWREKIKSLKPILALKWPEVNTYKIGDMSDAQTGNFKAYDFLGNNSGETTVWETIAQGISNAKSYIYMEDQYLVSRAASQALAARIKDGVIVVIVCCHPDGGIDIEQVWRRHADFVADLAAADPSGSRWTVTYLKAPGASPPYRAARNTYVHSKCWIFDDELAIIGSANCTRRSYTMDSEAVVAVHGVARPGDSKQIDQATISWPSFAQEFRLALWSKHLVRKQSDLLDPLAVMPLWFSPALSSHVAKLDPTQKSDVLKYPGYLASSVWDYFVDPDGS